MKLVEFIKIISPSLLDDWKAGYTFDESIGDYYDVDTFDVDRQAYTLEKWVHADKAGFSLSFNHTYTYNGVDMCCGKVQPNLILDFKRLSDDYLEYDETARTRLILDMVEDLTVRNISPYKKYDTLKQELEFSSNERR